MGTRIKTATHTTPFNQIGCVDNSTFTYSITASSGWLLSKTKLDTHMNLTQVAYKSVWKKLQYGSTLQGQISSWSWQTDSGSIIPSSLAFKHPHQVNKNDARPLFSLVMEGQAICLKRWTDYSGRIVILGPSVPASVCYFVRLAKKIKGELDFQILRRTGWEMLWSFEFEREILTRCCLSVSKEKNMTEYLAKMSGISVWRWWTYFWTKDMVLYIWYIKRQCIVMRILKDNFKKASCTEVNF